MRRSNSGSTVAQPVLSSARVTLITALCFAALSISAATAFAAPATAAAPTATAAAAPAAPAPLVLPSGVTVQHLKLGTGASPKASDTVTVHYRGTLQNGKEFDSSYARNAPASFPLSRVIPCWTEGVQKLKVGGKAKLVCPGPTAYGARGMPGTIPPNSTLNFEVELLSID